MNLSACGSDTSVTPVPTTISSGPITAFGSIYVNGVEFETDAAAIYVEDELSDESVLRVGMMVDIIEDGNGNALEVHHDDDLEGIVFINNITAGLTTGTMDIMGQIVTADENTIFSSDVDTIISIDAIVAGNIVEVSGHSTGTGSITATRLEVKAIDLASYLSEHPEGIEVKGLVTGHVAADQIFSIGSLTVNYGGAELDDLPTGISDNIYVEVKSIEGINISNQLVASKVELEDGGSIDLEGDDGDEYELKGEINAISISSITVNGHLFLITIDTVFEDGSLSDLAVGDIVEVEAYFNSTGELIAKEIEPEDDAISTEISGSVASVQVDGNNLGTITLVDASIILVNNETIMVDEQDDGMMPNLLFNLTDIAANDYLEIHVTSNDDGTFTAVKIEREDP